MNAICHARAFPGPDPRRARRPWPALQVVCAAVALALPGSCLADAVRWRTDYAGALKEATEKGVPLLVNVGGEGCVWCLQLDKRTFAVEEISKLVNTRFVPLKVDGNKNLALTQALKVQTYPTLIFASAEGAILGYREGFVEAPEMKEQLLKVLAAVATPDWMTRDFEAAGTAVEREDFARAITLLKGVVEDGKKRAVQVKARRLLAGLEKRAADQAARAAELAEKGKTVEALAALDTLGKNYPGTPAASRGDRLRLDLVSRSQYQGERRRQAREILAQAREDYKAMRLLCCLDRCEALSRDYGDLDEGRQADKLAGEIKDNTDWARTAAEQLSDRLCILYLAQADAWLRKGQPQQAIFYLDQVVKLHPSGRHAEVARGRLARLRGGPEGGVERK